MPSENVKSVPNRGMNRFSMPREKGNTKKTLGKILKALLKDYKFPMIIVLFCVIFGALASISSSIFLEMFIDDVIMPSLPYGNIDNVESTMKLIILAMIIVFGAGILASLAQAQIMARVSQGFMNKMRKNMFNKMESLPIKYFDQHPHGDIMSYYTNDVDSLRQFISQTMIQITSTCFTIIFLFCTMIYYSLWLTLVVIFGAFVLMLVSKNLAKKGSKFFVQQQKSLALTEGYIEEMMKGIKVVKVFCHEEIASNEFEKLNNQLKSDAKEANTFANIMGPVSNNVGHFFYVILAIVGSALVMNNAMNISLVGISILQIGMVVSFLTMNRQFTMSISQVTQQFNMIAMAMAGSKRIFELLDETEEVDDGYVTLVNANIDKNNNITESSSRTGHWAWKHPHHDGTTSYTELKGDIRFFDVDFGYYPEKIVLHDVSIYAKPGQKIAFVGATGAGKTTITNLINRFYDLADGKIRYDGININKIKKDDLRKSIGIVLQDTNLFTGTVMENIRYGKLDASDEDVYKAAIIANAYDFITRLPDGFNTILTGDGANLSQGQRQLLSIARAVIADAPVMILDEATSSIDTRTERLVQKGTDELMKGRTVFVIAHRLSTVQNANAIMVLENGHIIERGTHKDLIDLKGTYYQLYTGAFELE